MPDIQTLRSARQRLSGVRVSLPWESALLRLRGVGAGLCLRGELRQDFLCLGL
jgi:hypothetical protein